VPWPQNIFVINCIIEQIAFVYYKKEKQRALQLQKILPKR